MGVYILLTVGLVQVRLNTVAKNVGDQLVKTINCCSCYRHQPSIQCRVGLWGPGCWAGIHSAKAESDTERAHTMMVQGVGWGSIVPKQKVVLSMPIL